MCVSEPDWIEVITEVLLSMMSQGSNLARVTAKAAFGQLTGHVTTGSLKLIIEVGILCIELIL